MPKRTLTYEDMNYLKSRSTMQRHPHMALEGTVLTKEQTDDARLVGGVLWRGCIGLHSDAMVDNYQRELYTTLHHMESARIEEEIRALGHTHNCITLLSPEQNFGIVVLQEPGESVEDLKRMKSPFTDHLDREYYLVWRRKSGIYAKLPDTIQRDLLVEGLGLALEERTGKTCVTANFFVDDGVIYPFVARSVWEVELRRKRSKNSQRDNVGDDLFSKVAHASSLHFSEQKSSRSSAQKDTPTAKTILDGEIFHTRRQLSLTSAFQRQHSHSTSSALRKPKAVEPSATATTSAAATPTTTTTMADEDFVSWKGCTYRHAPTADEENMWYNTEKEEWFKRLDDGGFERREEFYEDDASEDAEDDAAATASSQMWKGERYTHAPTEDEDNMWYNNETEVWFKRNEDGSFEKRWEFYDDEEEEEEEQEVTKAIKLIEEMEREVDEDFDPEASGSSIDDMEVDEEEAQREDEANSAEEASSSEDEVTKVISDLHDFDRDKTFDPDLGRELTREEEEERLREESAGFIVSDEDALKEVKRSMKKTSAKDKARPKKKMSAKDKARPKKKKQEQQQKKPAKKKKDETSSEDSASFTDNSASSMDDDEEESEIEDGIPMADIHLDKGAERSKARREAVKNNKKTQRRTLAEEKKRVKELEEEVERKKAEAKRINDAARAANKLKKETAVRKKKAADAKIKDKFYLCIQGMNLKEAVTAQKVFMEETKRVSEMVDSLSDDERRGLCYSILGAADPHILLAIRTLLEDFADFGSQIAFASIAPKQDTVSEMRRVRLQAALSLLGGKRLGGDCKTRPTSKREKHWPISREAVPKFIGDRFAEETSERI